MSRPPMPEPRPLEQGGATSVDERAAAKLLEGYAVPIPDDLTVERVWHRIVRPAEQSRAARPTWLIGLLAPALALCIALVLLVVVIRGHGQRGSRSSPPVATAVATAVASAAGSVVAPAVAPASGAELAAVQGAVFFSRPAERWQPGQEGQSLAEGQSVRTDPNGRTVLDILGADRGIASVLVARGTDLAIERLNGGTFLRLSRGSVVARVTKRPPSEPFVILTHRFSVKVVGTLFQVDQDASDRTAVSVREGVVEVTDANGRSWRLHAGQSWSSASPEQLGASAIADPVKTLLEDSLKRVPPPELDRELSAVDASVPLEVTLPPSAPTADVRSPARVKTPSVLRNDAEVRADGRSSGTPTPLPPPPLLLATREPAPASDSQRGFDTFPAPAPVAATGPATSAAPSAGTYSDGVALESAGKLQAAAEAFVQAEKGDPSHADLALYALGRLRQHRLSDPQGALQAFQTYRHAYPNGALLPEVDLAVLEVEVASGHRDQALAESVRFLAAHPASERTDEVRLVRGNLLRDGGDCRAALGEYRQVDARAFADEALYEIAYCQRMLGDAAGARESLHAYRARFPAGPHRDEVAKELRE